MLLSFDNKKAAIALYRLMIRILKYFLCATSAVIVIACTDDDSFTTSPNNRLTFSTDTVRMDTVFSSVPTSTRTFWVYNRSGDGIRCLSVGLERGNQSGFRVNVDGSYLGSSSGYQVSDIEVRDKDSIRVFVELTSPLNHGNTPQKIEDNLVFRLESGIEQKVNLNAWSWDADMMRDVVVESDMTIGGDVPVIIYGGIVVREGATLTLNDGVTLYFHDGAGIDVEKVRKKAIERGLIHPNKIISDHDAYQLIFEPGFSTADKITNVSGRGVGLDVVKTSIEKLNGTVVVTSEKGIGTKFCIRLPLTMAIIQGLLVRVATEVYSIPIASVIESVRVKKEEISTIDNYEVLNVRNEVISIIRLDRLFGLKNKTESEYNFIVIVGTTDKKIGVMVDALIGEEDVVIKPLRDQFTNSPGIAGASILGDGSVSLIIDVSQLLELGVKQELIARQEREAVIL